MKALRQQRAHWPRNAVFAACLISWWAAVSHAEEFDTTSALFGEPSAAGRFVLKELAGRPLAYFNLAQTAPGRAMTEVRTALQHGRVVLLDATQAHDPSLIDQVTSPLLGVSVSKPLIAIARYADGTLNLHAGDYSGHVGLARNLSRELARARHAKREAAQRARGVPLEGKSMYITFAHDRLSCTLPGRIEKAQYFVASRIELSEPFDACVARASYHAKVRLDYFSSNSRGVSSHFPAGKLLRIVQGLGNPAGSGWHMVDAPRNETKSTMVGLWTYKYTAWFGPYVGAYGVTLTLDNDQDVSLIEHEPKNTPRGMDVDVMRGEIKQRGFSAGAVASSAPSGSFTYSGMDSATASTTLKYKLNEYELINRSSGNRVDLQWRHALGEEMRSTPDEIVNGAKPVKQQFVSGMSYANFTPGYLATYHAPFDKQGTSTFSLTSSATVNALLSYVRGDEHYYQVSDHPLRFTDTFRIDWQSLDFLPDAPVMLKAYRHDRPYCLGLLREGGNDVVTAPCDSSRRQLWMQNNHGQFVSVSSPALCLVGRRDDLLKAAPCERSGFQQWRWEGQERDRLYNVATRKSVVNTGAGNSLAPLWSAADCDGGDNRGLCAWRAYEP